MLVKDRKKKFGFVCVCVCFLSDTLLGTKRKDLKLEKIFVQVGKVDNYIQLQNFQELQKYINILEEDSRKMTK